jgi:hypothetical protein
MCKNNIVEFVNPVGDKFYNTFVDNFALNLSIWLFEFYIIRLLLFHQHFTICEVKNINVHV